MADATRADDYECRGRELESPRRKYGHSPTLVRRFTAAIHAEVANGPTELEAVRFANEKQKWGNVAWRRVEMLIGEAIAGAFDPAIVAALQAARRAVWEIQLADGTAHAFTLHDGVRDALKAACEAAGGGLSKARGRAVRLEDTGAHEL